MPNTIAQNLTRLANAKEAIAEAIEGKGGTLEEGDGFEDFANAISSIITGGNLTTKTITQNGTYYAEDDNADGYSAVTVNVSSLSAMDKVVFSTDAVPLNSKLYAQLSAADIDVTCYAVIAAPKGQGGYEVILLNIPYALSNGNDPAFYAPYTYEEVYATVYGNNEIIPGVTCHDYHVYTIAVDSTNKKAKFYVDGVLCKEKTFSHSGDKVIIGSGDIGLTRFQQRPTLCKYLGVVESLQSDADIIAKHQELMTRYNIT